MKLIEYADRQQQAQLLANVVADQLQVVADNHGQASLAVPGGTTPAPFLQALAACSVDWSKVTVTLTDERQVPPDHERSNAKLLRDNFLEAVPEVRFVGLFGEQGGSDGDGLQCFPLTSCILGMGTDGHFASLFPAAGNLEHGLNPENPDVLMEVAAENIPEPRISLTLAAILTAPAIHLLISGEEKLRVLTQAQQNAGRSDVNRVYPVEALIRHAGSSLTIHYAK